MKNIEDDISTLKFSLRKIKRMLFSAEKRIENRKDDAVKDWIAKVRDVMYEVEDFLDVLVLTNVQRDKDEGTLRSFMPSFFYDLIESSNIQDIQGKVDRILQLAEYYDLKNIEINVRQLQRTETSSTFVVGREKEKAQVIEMLIPKSTDEKSYDVIPIIGLGGVGKTTLAQVIYNNEDVQRHFQLKIWVCVSTDFDMIRLTKEIIMSICNQSKEEETKTRTDYFGDDNWDALQTKLRELLTKGGRFLLVLDDVWDEGQDNWDEFMKPFQYGQKGSRILVTTRKSIVARIFSKNEIKLEGLPDGDFWTLFEKFAFGGSNSSGLHWRNPNLEAIGREIVKKLKGSPLAAKTVGRFLSHQELPDYLKPCFAFFSLFPKDDIFSRDELIRMWCAHSWIKDEEKKSMEDVGKNYWNELLSRCMIEYSFGHWKMHDQIHDLALFVSNKEYFCIKSEKDLLEIPESVRHLSVYSSDAMQFEIIKYQKIFNNLRTLIISSTSCKLDLDMIFQVAKKLRVLKVRGILDEDVPNSIQQLCHLRYLDFNWNRIRSIPDSLCELHFLQVLLLDDCPLQNLPKELYAMVNLRHLCISHQK